MTENYAALWTDGRYFTQAQKELDSNWTLMKEGILETPILFLFNLKINMTIKI